MDSLYILFELYIVLYIVLFLFLGLGLFLGRNLNKGERRGEGGGNHLFRLLLLPNDSFHLKVLNQQRRARRTVMFSDVHCPFLIGI
jgi:hypothetical protein